MTAPAEPASWRARLAGVARKWRNTSFSALDHLWMLALWAASTPIFISTLGEDLFGVFLLINTLIGLGGVMSFGFGEATMRYVAHYTGQNDPETAQKVVETSMLFYAATTLPFTLAIWFGAPWMAEGAFGLTGDIADQAIGGLRMAAVALMVTAFVKTWEPAINGFERFDITARVSIVARSVIILGNVTLAVLGFGLPALLTTTATALTGQALVVFWILRRQFIPRLQIMGWPSPKVTGEILRFGLQIWLQVCAGAMSNLVDRFIVGALIGPAAAGVYGVCLQLAQQVHLLLYRGLAYMHPAASRDTASGAGAEALSASYRTAVWLTLAVVFAISLPLYVLADQVLTLWVGADFAEQGATLLRWLVIYFAIMGTTIAPYMLVNGAGFPGWNTTGGLLAGGTILVVASQALPVLGLDGIALARMASVPMIGFTLYALHRKVMPGQGLKQTLLMVLGLGVICALVILVNAVLNPLVPARWIPVIGAVLGLTAAGAGLVIGPFLLLRRMGRA